MDINVPNLTILRDHMTTVPDNKLSMVNYVSSPQNPGDPVEEWELSVNLDPYKATEYLNKCGTSACLLGHAATRFPIKSNIHWGNLSNYLFGIKRFTNERITLKTNPLWEFIFGQQNSNSINHAIERLDLVIKENS